MATQVDRNMTVSEQMMSDWPFWAFLRRVEASARVVLPSELLRIPPGPGALQHVPMV